MPTFSIIITTFNRPVLLRRCVESVLAQDYAGEYEIIVVDDGSKPPVDLAAFAPRVLVIRQAQTGWGLARLTGVQRSSGAILLFLDDDCFAPPHWLATYARYFADMPEYDGISGSLRPDGPMNTAGYRQYSGHRTYFERMNQPLGVRFDAPGRCHFSFGGNRAFKREIWLSAQADVGGWYGDDTAIDVQLRRQDAVIYYTPEIWVRHHYVLSLGQRLLAAHRYGLSRSTVVLQTQSAPTVSRWRQLRDDVRATSLRQTFWYYLTQPLVHLARRWGQIRHR